MTTTRSSVPLRLTRTSNILRREQNAEETKEYDGDKAQPALVCHVDLAQRESLVK